MEGAAGLICRRRVIASDLAPPKTQDNAAIPGVIETAPMGDLGRGGGPAGVHRESRIPLGVPGAAYMGALLCRGMGAWTTGQDLAVDGGTTWR